MAVRFQSSPASAPLWFDICCKCKTEFAMSDAVYRTAQERKAAFTFYCPNGHPQHYVEGETDEQKLRRERDRLKQNEAWYEQRLKDERENHAATNRRLIASRGQVTRLRNRAAAGVCPCCHRTVSQMAKHMATKHPGFKAEAVE